MIFDITHTKPPRSSGKKTYKSLELSSNVFIKKKKKKKKKKKRSVIQLDNAKDSLCFARAVVVEICYSEKENTETWNKRWNFIRHSNKPLQKTEAEKLLNEARVSQTQPVKN